MGQTGWDYATCFNCEGVLAKNNLFDCIGWVSQSVMAPHGKGQS